jgi:hypothetical protein
LIVLINQCPQTCLALCRQADGLNETIGPIT